MFHNELFLRLYCRLNGLSRERAEHLDPAVSIPEIDICHQDGDVVISQPTCIM